jgi:hypothetical protein
MAGAKKVHLDDWSYVATLLPHDLGHLAVETGAIRRWREVASGEALARLVLAYGVTDLSFKEVAAWAAAEGVARLSGPGLFYRVCHAEAWIERVLAMVLSREVGVCRGRGRLRVVDATVLSGPAAKGTDWRVHVVTDPATGRFCSVEVTDEHSRETFGRHSMLPGDIVVGDMGYGTARGIYAAVHAGADVIVRVYPQNIRVCDHDRAVVCLRDRESMLPTVGPRGWDVLVPVPPYEVIGPRKWTNAQAVDWMPLRAVAARTRGEKTIWVLTTLPEARWCDAHVLDAYRLRWQVELFFKRLKSLGDLGCLRTRHGPSARAWILAHLLGCALAIRLEEESRSLSPWGYEMPGGGTGQ